MAAFAPLVGPEKCDVAWGGQAFQMQRLVACPPPLLIRASRGRQGGQATIQ